jgi:biopolymer transport protein ExbD
MKLSQKRHIKKVVELNVTTFMNLMVILVPFLLITAVFSKVTVLELNLPALNAQNIQEEKLELQLEIHIRETSFDIRDNNLGLIKHFERTAERTDWKTFTDILIEIKSRFPASTSITLLLDKKVNYKTLIEVMDRVRSADVVQVTTVETVELFPNISIGDVPEAEPANNVSEAPAP